MLQCDAMNLRDRDNVNVSSIFRYAVNWDCVNCRCACCLIVNGRTAVAADAVAAVAATAIATAAATTTAASE